MTGMMLVKIMLMMMMMMVLLLQSTCRHMLQHMRLLLEILKIGFLKEVIFRFFNPEIVMGDFIIGTKFENDWASMNQQSSCGIFRIYGR